MHPGPMGPKLLQQQLLQPQLSQQRKESSVAGPGLTTAHLRQEGASLCQASTRDQVRGLEDEEGIF